MKQISKKHSTSHALIYLIDKTREQLDKESFGCGIFVDFQKAFDTIYHDILIRKSNYYGARQPETVFFLEYRTQFVRIIVYSSNLNFIHSVKSMNRQVNYGLKNLNN